MSTRRTRFGRVPGILVAIAVLVVGPASASAQTSRPAEPPSKPATSQAAAGETGPRGLLAGPKVSEEAKSARGRPIRDQSPTANRRGRTRRWLEEVRRLDLRADQRAELRAMVAELTAAREVFEDAHGRELRVLRRQAREARLESRRPAEDVRNRLAAIAERAPDVAAYQERFWRKLDATQQETLRQALRESAKRRQAPERDGRPDARGDRKSDTKRDGKSAAMGDDDWEIRDLDDASRRRLRFLLANRGG